MRFTHPACRHADRTISSPIEEIGVWRVVSEDSDHLSARLTVIHCLHDFDDIEQPTYREVCVRLDHFHALHELQKIQMFRSSQ